MRKRNIYPNNYIIGYTDNKGTRHTIEIRGLTADEAIIRFRATDITAKNVTAKLKSTDRPYKFSELFH